jgi:hypothetical protein
LDCTVLALAALHALGARTIATLGALAERRKPPEPPPEPRETPAPPPRRPARRGGWVNGWNR